MTLIEVAEETAGEDRSGGSILRWSLGLPNNSVCSLAVALPSGAEEVVGDQLRTDSAFSDLLAAWTADRAPKDPRLVNTPFSLDVSLRGRSASSQPPYPILMSLSR
jgi:hypothetical protein